jgi:hypothetical protein
MTEERIDLEGPRKKFSVPRALLLVCVILGTVWAYSRHFEGVADRFQRVDGIRDETGTLPPEKIKLLRDSSRAMQDTYGVALRVVVSRSPVSPPAQDPKILFIGLDVSAGKAVVVIPPLLARALPPELAQRLSSGYFDPFFAENAWPEGLYSCVLAILEALREQR